MNHDQSHYREVPGWEIFMEQDVRFGLEIRPVDITEKKTFGKTFSSFRGQKKLKT